MSPLELSCARDDMTAGKNIKTNINIVLVFETCFFFIFESSYKSNSFSICFSLPLKFLALLVLWPLHILCVLQLVVL